MKKTKSKRRQRGNKNLLLLLIAGIILSIGIILVIGIGVYPFIIGSWEDAVLNGKETGIPIGDTHWHPKLTIRIDGEEVPIPDDIGVGTGRVVDTELSGMDMSPTHTHESDGTIHIENTNPSAKPETLTLGYFFYVWEKPLSSTCIFEHCTTNGTLKMYVNGVENTEFGDYIMHDGDDILIEYIFEAAP